MTKLVVYFAAIILLLTVQAAMPHWQGAVPHLLFLFALFCAFSKYNEDYLWVAFFSGLALDIYSGSLFGSYAFSFLIIVFAVNYTTRTFFSSDPHLFYMALVIAVSFLMLVGLLYLINSFGSSIAVLSPAYLSRKIWLDLLLSLIFAGPVFMLNLFAEKIIMKKEQSKIVI